MSVIRTNPTHCDERSWFQTIWDALHHWRSLALEPNDPTDDEDWNKVTEAMAWITEELGYELDEDGDYVRDPDHERREPMFYE